MHNASSVFAANPQSTDNRAAMVQASRGLLVAIARLLIVADVADIYKLLNATSRVSVSVSLFVVQMAGCMRHVYPLSMVTGMLCFLSEGPLKNVYECCYDTAILTGSVKISRSH